MKNLVLIITTLFLCNNSIAQKGIQLSDPSTCPYKLGIPVEVKLPEKGFSHPKISPDGTKLLLTKRYEGIYVAGIDNPKEIKKISSGRMDGFHMKWIGKNNEISYRRSTRLSEGNFKRQYFITDPYLKSFSAHDITNIDSPVASLQTENNNLFVGYDVKNECLVANDGTKVWSITPKTNGVFMDIVLSPDKSKVVFSRYGREYVYAVDGSGMITNFIAGLGKNWSPDGKYILFYYALEKGHDYIVESDLYICKTDGSEYWKLTVTPDILEVDPHWSLACDQITFTDKKTGKIYVTTIHKK